MNNIDIIFLLRSFLLSFIELLQFCYLSSKTCFSVFHQLCTWLYIVSSLFFACGKIRLKSFTSCVFIDPTNFVINHSTYLFFTEFHISFVSKVIGLASGGACALLVDLIDFLVNENRFVFHDSLGFCRLTLNIRKCTECGRKSDITRLLIACYYYGVGKSFTFFISFLTKPLKNTKQTMYSYICFFVFFFFASI